MHPRVRWTCLHTRASTGHCATPLLADGVPFACFSKRAQASLLRAIPFCADGVSFACFLVRGQACLLPRDVDWPLHDSAPCIRDLLNRARTCLPASSCENVPASFLVRGRAIVQLRTFLTETCLLASSFEDKPTCFLVRGQAIVRLRSVRTGAVCLLPRARTSLPASSCVDRPLRDSA